MPDRNNIVSKDSYSFSQEGPPPDPEPRSLLGGNDYPDASTNSDCGHAKIDGRTNDTPQLVRTSTITRKTGKNSNFPHISLSSDQAVLEISGKLESMAENWTSEEWANRRRIVLFHKTQRGSTVKATCQPVSIKERQINSICISCIWWAEKGGCYVTSVDALNLLEQLIAAPNRFSVEEKNRIRRNLEGFHPQTVYKTKPDSQEFFKIIMGFPNPKPLSIEKDIKVFPWKILDSALKNIFDKYTVFSGRTAAAPDAESGQQEFTTPGSNDNAQLYKIPTRPQQVYPVTETGSPDVATITNLVPTHYQLSQEVEQPLTNLSCLAPEITTFTQNYSSTIYATPVHKSMLSEGFYAHQAGSQPVQHHMAPQFTISPGPLHSSSSHAASFPMSQYHSPFLNSLEAGVSDDFLPEKCVSQAQVSKQAMEELQSGQVSVCQPPTQKNVPIDPVLTSDVELDSNSEQAKTHRGSTPGAKAATKNLRQRNNGVLSCPPCRMTFPNSRDHERHLRTHTGERPFECKWQSCDRKFAREDNMKRHAEICRDKSAASVTSDGVSEDSYSFSQEGPPPDPEPRSLLGGNDYPDASTNSDCGHAKIDGRTNDTPQLVRTSTITRKTGKNSNFPHISLSSDQAVLKIAGKLESMAENWTSEEWANRRRVVLFHKTQKGSTVNATYQSVSVNNILHGSIYISCIWWAEKGECYVTSVDTIYLLEQLIVGPNHFNVQEKSRVSGNLAAFQSQTVSKNKPDTEAFFNIIMGFSNPKPRKLEKDIKVFPWRILEDALNRVFGKYSISPSHTVAALNVDPGQREFTMPESQRMLPLHRRATTPQQACPVTETGSPDVATITNLVPTHYLLSQEIEQPLTDLSCSAPETETLTDDYPSTIYATSAHNSMLPEAFYAPQARSQAIQHHMAPHSTISLNPLHSSSFQSALFPTSQCHSPFLNSLEAGVSDDLLPEKCVSQAQVSKQPMEELQSGQVSVCRSPAQRDALVDSVLTSDIQLDSNSEEAKSHREPSDGVSEGPSGFPHQTRPAPDSNPLSLQNELNLLGTLIQDESDSDSAEDEIVVCLRPQQDHRKHNAPTLSLEKHVNGVDDTNPGTEEQARGNKPSVTYTNGDWGYAIADGKNTIDYENVPSIDFDRILNRFFDSFLQRDIEYQQEAETCKGMTGSKINVMKMILLDLEGLDLEGLDLSRISVDKADDTLKTVCEALIKEMD
ncbi:Krueppel-like factor 11 [Fusarium oxysporum f. sp. raphani]|uniref:Krueppel-like factor 11 n=1 Tax=Fusarium oxysporum f. sp. raphani TaxID=96318 RepID=A0A8J5PTS4_FUSOX|nr:Krueppel-like factor 11 [Fusarium oxysporum f. sp. raphani]